MKILLFLAFLIVFSPVSAQETDVDVLTARAKNGDVEASGQLGKYLFDIEKNPRSAEKWLKASADAGNVESKYYLARVYDSAGKRSNAEIVALLQESAGRGYVPAQVMLGKILQFGRRGVPQNTDQARGWYEMAAAKGSGEAMAQLRVIYAQTGDQSVKAGLADENVEWLTLGAKQGDADAAAALGGLFETGRGVKRDFKRAAELYQTAAEAGNTQAMAGLGKLYANGDGVEQNDERAIFWLDRAARAGYVEAQRKLAEVYTLRSSDKPKAYAWLVLALSALFPAADDLSAVSPDLERLMRSMTAEEIRAGQAYALDMLEIVKANKRKQRTE